MVRALRGVAYVLVAAFFALYVPAGALADEEMVVENGGGVSYPYVDYSAQLQSLSVGLGNVETQLETQRYELQQKLTSIETLLTPVEEVEKVEEKKEEKSDEVKLLESLNETVSGLAKSEVVEIEEQQPVQQTRAATSFTAYTNVSPTGTYAQYAIGYLPRVGYGEHYCFLQDTSSSYTFAWGDLAKSGSNISGNAKWVRWYYTSNYNYVMQSGEGSVTISPDNHTVMSDLDGWPMLGDGTDAMRKEVGFYAVVALCIFSLASVLNFTLRVRAAIVAE